MPMRNRGQIEAPCAIAHLWCPVAAGSAEETLLLGSSSGQPVPSAKVSKSGSRNKGLQFDNQRREAHPIQQTSWRL